MRLQRTTCILKKMDKKDIKLLPESKELLNILLTDVQKEIVERAIKEIKENPESYNIDFFWQMDALIGGIGGYCMSFDPRLNPFPIGIGRSLFRPLQYAWADIEDGKEICNHARHTVQDSGLHLEWVVKYVAWEISNKIGRVNLSIKKITLGQGIKMLEDREVLSINLIKPLDLFLKLYNKSKHEINQDEERERLFSPADALIAYISARIIGKELLKPYFSKILKNIGEYLGRLK